MNKVGYIKKTGPKEWTFYFYSRYNSALLWIKFNNYQRARVELDARKVSVQRGFTL